MPKKKHVVAIAGNVGAGKTALAELLAKELGWDAFLEEVKKNPYIADFYGDMRRWGFHSQVFYLARKLRSYARAREHPKSVILDRTIYEDAEVFAKNLFLSKLMSARDWRTYRYICGAQLPLLPKPDLVVYLEASVETLLKRIALRGRGYEQNVDPAYLARLNDLYEKLIRKLRRQGIRVLSEPADDLDFVKNPDHLRMIALDILKKLS